MNNDGHEVIALALLEKGTIGASCLVSILDKLDVDRTKIAKWLVEKNHQNEVLLHMECFPSLDLVELSGWLLQYGRIDSLCFHLDKFELSVDELSHLATSLIAYGYGHSVASCLEKFIGIDHGEIAIFLIDAGQANSIMKNLSKFGENTLDEKVVENIGIPSRREWMFENIDKFKPQAQLLIIKNYIDNGDTEVVAKCVGYVSRVDHNVIASLLVNEGEGYYVARYLESFKNLKGEIHENIKAELAEIKMYCQENDND